MKTRMILPAIFAAAVMAQGPGGPRMGPGMGLGAPRAGTSEVKAFLSLTDAQIQALQQIRTQEAQALQALHQQIGQKQAALRDLLDKGSTDAAALGKLMVEIQALRKQIAQSDTTFRDQARNTLTAEQKTKLKSLEDAAKLQAAIHGAAALNLLTPPEGGPAFGPGGMVGPAGFGGPGRMRLGARQ